MHQYGDGSVTLSTTEEEIHSLHRQLVAEGMPAEEAAGHALAAMPNPDPGFARWLIESSDSDT